MPCPHFSITIVKGSKGKSAVASAAYQSGQKLYSEREVRMKDYSRKKGVVETGILLPAHAPPEYSNREVLWNSVESAEKRWDAQYARQIVAALPREIPKQDYYELVRKFCYENFVQKGMCCDFAIHDDGTGNPHVHILLTMRGIDENGKWMPKSKMVYDLDEDGNKIRLPSGNYKSHKANTVDWNDKKYAEEWRHAWEEINNSYLARYGRRERLDMRSYKRQGRDEVPTVHMGSAALRLEQKGEETFLGTLNRAIKESNREHSMVRYNLRNLADALRNVMEALKEDEERKETAVDVIFEYMEKRKEGRQDWNKAARQTGSTNDLKKESQLVNFLQYRNIMDIDAFKAFAEEVLDKDKNLRSKVSKCEKREKEIQKILETAETRKKYSEIHDTYLNIHWKHKQEKYRNEHADELAKYNKAERYLRSRYPDGKVPVSGLKTELKKLDNEKYSAENERKVIASDVEYVKQILRILKEMRPELFAEKAKPEEVKAKANVNVNVNAEQTVSGTERKEERASLLGKLHRYQKEIDEKEKEKPAKSAERKRDNMAL